MATATKAKTATKPVKKAPPRHTFAWEGKDKAGKKVRGETVGQNQQLVKAQLKKQGIVPTKFKKKQRLVEKRYSQLTSHFLHASWQP